MNSFHLHERFPLAGRTVEKNAGENERNEIRRFDE